MRTWAEAHLLCHKTKFFMGVWQLQSLQYICAPFGPFVQGLGRQVFILETGVRFPYGLQNRLQVTDLQALLFLVSQMFPQISSDSVLCSLHC